MKNKDWRYSYRKAVEERQQEKMDWPFEEFLEMVEDPLKVQKQNNSKNRITVWSMIAAAAIVISFGLVWLFQSLPAVGKNTHLLAREKPSADLTGVALTKNPDSISLSYDSLEAEEDLDIKVQQNLDKILTKKSRLRKPARNYLVQTPPRRSDLNKDENNEVIFAEINGEKITDEALALEITRYSMDLFRDKMAASMNIEENKLEETP